MSKNDYLDSGAQLSACGKYRYTLWRIWDETLPVVAFVGLNPSTADASKDDPTIRRCRGFAMSHGYGGMVMLNLWAYRSTDPDSLPQLHSVPDEDENLSHIASKVETVDRVVAVWGAHPMARMRAHAVMPLVSDWWCLGKTQGGHPRHPLYLKNTSQMQRLFTVPAQGT